MKLILENVRCFYGRHTIPLAPLTLLVGENSTGKSTFLAALAAVCDPHGFPFRPRFNEAPYSLGTYETIATARPVPFGRSESFSMGFVQEAGRSTVELEFCARYINRRGQPGVAEVSLRASGATITLTIDPSERRSSMAVVMDSRPEEHWVFDYPDKDFLGETAPLEFKQLLAFSSGFFGWTSDPKPDQSVMDRLGGLLRQFEASTPPGVVSIAPVRTRPKRTYDQATAEFVPEGDHIPFALMSSLTDKSLAEEREALTQALRHYGKEAGLFDDIDVKVWGDEPGAPFQIRVWRGGRSDNLTDVGYGVSQSLPLIVQPVLSGRRRLFLLQQPEVHLHPRAQAALGSFFADLVVEGKKELVIETHSDYIVDRIRQEVAAGKIAHSQVGILYFARTNGDVTVYPISLDPLGNVVDVPPTYREFFLREELNLLSRSPA